MFSLIGPQKTSITPRPWQSKVWVLAALGDLPSLKLTAKAPENGGFQIRNLLEPGCPYYFQGLLLLVSGSVCLVAELDGSFQLAASNIDEIVVSKWVFPKIRGKTTQNGWFIYVYFMENPYEQMDDLGG